MSKFLLEYKKIGEIDLEVLERQYTDSNPQDEGKYAPFHIEGLQSYNPLYNDMFELNSENFDTITLNQKYQFLDLDKVLDSESDVIISKESFIKFSPLLDPVRYLIGKYQKKDDTISITELPSIQKTVHPKLNSIHNASYVDNFFCFLSSQVLNRHGLINGIDYYGSFLGIQEKYKMNIADDIEYLNQSDFFLKNRTVLYELDDTEDPFSNFGSRCNKNRLEIRNSSEVSHISVEDLDMDVNDTVNDTVNHTNDSKELLYEKDHVDDSSDDDSNNSEKNYTSDEDDGKEEEDDEEEEEDDEEEDDEEEDEDEDEEEDEDEDEDDSDESDDSEEPCIFTYIKEFPVQMICLEKCTGTIDELFSRGEMDESNSAAALFQIIMTLIAYQKSFHFTHNDLHTNNIVFIETEQEFLFYKFDGKMYKVPTYGKIFKIIDFGRAIYKLNGKIYCSDSFDIGGDASTQYNCEPFLNDKKPRLEPNFSFDLCRLGCSIYDFILDEEIDENEKIDELQRTVIRWCSDDSGKNVLYKKNGEERYPNFKLYKMIARTVNEHLPTSQLEDPYFSQFLSGEESLDMVNIDAIPCFV